MPGIDLAVGYFNLETNCGGHMLFHHQLVPRGTAVTISREDCDRIALNHSMPSTLDPETLGPVVWTQQYRLPLEILSHYAPVTHLGQTGPAVTKSPMLAHLQELLDAGTADGSFRRGLDARQVLVSLIGLCLIYFSNRHTLARTVGLDVSAPHVMQSAIESTAALLLDGISRHNRS